MSRHEAGLVAAPTAAEPLIDIAYFNTLFSTPAPSSGQRASRFACDALVCAGEGTKWAGWYPVKLLPLLGVGRVRRANRGRDYLPVAQAKERFAELNGGNPWAPQLTELTWPKKVKSIDVDRLQMKKLRDDALRRGCVALRTRKPTLLKAPPIAVPAFLYWRPDQSMIWARTRQEAHRRRQDDAAMIKLFDFCYMAAPRPPTPEPEIRTDWQDEIVKLHARGGSLGVIRDATQARGLQIDDDGVSEVLGPGGYMFGDGDPSAAAVMDDETEAFNAEPERDLPYKVRPRGRRWSYPRPCGQRISFWPSISSFCHAGKYKRAKLWTWSTEAAPRGSPYDPECYFSRPPLVGRVLGTALSEESWTHASETFGTHYTKYNGTGRSAWSHIVPPIETNASWPPERWPRIRHPWFRISHKDTPYVAFGAIASFAEVATLWNERPEATTSVDAINGYSEDPDWRAQHLRQKAMSAADYDAVAGVGRSVRTGPEPRRLPNGTAKQDELTRDATELIELNPAQSDVPEQQTQCEDWWAAAIRNYAYGRDRVYVDDVCRHASKKFEHGKFGKKEQLRISKVFVSMGWEHWRTKNGRGFVNRDRHHFSQ